MQTQLQGTVSVPPTPHPVHHLLAQDRGAWPGLDPISSHALRSGAPDRSACLPPEPPWDAILCRTQEVAVPTVLALGVSVGGSRAAQITAQLKPRGVTGSRVTPPQVFDGQDGASRPLGTFTRRELLGLTLNSTSNHLRLEFDSNGADTAAGFQLSYTSE